MLKYSELQSAFSEYGISIEEYNIETDEDITVPYIAYVATDGDFFGADGVNYLQLLNINLVMLDEKMNFELQQSIEEVLNTYSISFNKNINFDEANRLYSVSFFFNVMEG